MLNINKKITGEKAVVELEGRLDTVTAPELEKEIKNPEPEVTELVLDFNKLEYISSAGLRVLLAAQKVMAKRGTMKIAGANEMIMEIFEVTGFADILTVE